MSAENLSLRRSLQQAEHQLLELGSCPVGRRKDLVHSILLGKEEELAAMERQRDLLLTELDALKAMSRQRLHSPPRNSDSKNNHHHHHNNGYSNGYHNGKRRETRPETDIMSQDAARMVILSEVRRLKDAHKAAEEEHRILEDKVFQSL